MSCESGDSPSSPEWWQRGTEHAVRALCSHLSEDFELWVDIGLLLVPVDVVDDAIHLVCDAHATGSDCLFAHRQPPVTNVPRKQLQQPEHVHARVQRQDAVGGLRRAAA